MEKEISKELGLDLKFDKEKKTVRLSLDYDGKMADAGMFIELDSIQFIDLLAEKIPGKLDDMAFDYLKSVVV